MPRDYKQESLRHFNRIAGRYDAHAYGKQTHKVHALVVQIVNEFDPPSLLDVGCGNGGFISMVQMPARVLAGADLSPEMIKCARARLGEHVELQVADSEHLPWPDSKFDCLTCNFSFHHYPNPTLVLREFARVLKPGGHLIITDPWAAGTFRLISNFLLKLFRLGDVRIYSLDEMQSLLEAADFHITQLDHRSTSSLAVARKPR